MGALALLSAFCGFIFGLFFYILFSIMGDSDAWAWAVIGGVCFTIMLHTYLLISMKRQEKKYAKLEKLIDLPIVAKANGNVYPEDGRVYNANIYFCDSAVILLSAEQRLGHMQLFEKSEITDITRTDTGLDITVNGGVFLHLLIPEADALFKKLDETGWKYRE